MKMNDPKIEIQFDPNNGRPSHIYGVSHSRHVELNKLLEPLLEKFNDSMRNDRKEYGLDALFNEATALGNTFGEQMHIIHLISFKQGGTHARRQIRDGKVEVVEVRMEEQKINLSDIKF